MPGLRLAITAASIAALLGTAGAQGLRGTQEEERADEQRRLDPYAEENAELRESIDRAADTGDADDDRDSGDSDGELTDEERMALPAPDLPRIDDIRNEAREPVSVGDRFHQNNRPSGLQAGPWRIDPSLTLRAGYDDNVTTVSEAADQIASTVFQMRGRVDITNADGPNSFTAFGEVVHTWYADAPDLDHFDYAAGVGGSVQVSDYIRIRGTLGVTYAEVEDSANEGVVIGGAFDPYVDLSRYMAIPASLGVTFDSGHWYAEADGSVVYSEYDDRITASGQIVDQNFKNGTVADLRFRTGWRFTPGTALFAEAAYNFQRYEDKTANSDGWRVVGGAEFELSRLLTGDVFAGYAAQSFEQGSEVTGLTYGASLTWFPTELISVNLQARRDFGAERSEVIAGVPETVPVTRDNVALRIEYEPLRQLLVTAEGGWQGTNYEAGDRTDDTYYAGLGLEYVFTPNFHLTLDYRYEETNSSVAGDATRNVIWLGVRAQY